RGRPHHTGNRGRVGAHVLGTGRPQKRAANLICGTGDDANIGAHNERTGHSRGQPNASAVHSTPAANMASPSNEYPADTAAGNRLLGSSAAMRAHRYAASHTAPVAANAHTAAAVTAPPRSAAAAG